MAHVHQDGVASAEAVGSEELVGITGGDDLFGRLESQVEAAVARMAALTEERDALRARVLAQDEAIESLRANSDAAAVQTGEVQALRDDRDRLLRERAAAVKRVEAVLQRLDRLGLE